MVVITNTVQDTRLKLGGAATESVVSKEMKNLRASLASLTLYRRLDSAPHVISELEAHFSDPSNTVTHGLTLTKITVMAPDGTTFQDIDRPTSWKGLTAAQMGDIGTFMDSGLGSQTRAHAAVLTVCQDAWQRFKPGCFV
jgi:hypothetical protein